MLQSLSVSPSHGTIGRAKRFLQTKLLHLPNSLDTFSLTFLTSLSRLPFKAGLLCSWSNGWLLIEWEEFLVTTCREYFEHMIVYSEVCTLWIFQSQKYLTFPRSKRRLIFPKVSGQPPEILTHQGSKFINCDTRRRTP